MGTKFRTMLAPIDTSTGDGRRFGTDAIELAAMPIPFEWARSREGGHDGAVVVGAVHEAAILTVADAVAGEWISAQAAKAIKLGNKATAIWARGEIFDDVDREEMPRLAEDVAEAGRLISEGVLGPSVDLDSFEGVPVLKGTDDPLSYEDFERIMIETGEEPDIELLITAGRVRAATLVSIPAFQETSRPLELLPEEQSEATELALVASLGVAGWNAIDFDAPALDGPTPITFDFAAGRVYGHIATWGTCHAGYPGVCVTPPRDPDGGSYPLFNRLPVETRDGVVWAGRLTVGGRHPGLELTASGTMAAYDSKRVAAWVRASEDEHGIVIAGVIEPDLSEEHRRVLARRKVSGDWREAPNGLALVELLALSPGPRRQAEPGFPVATHSRNGRQTALVASFGPDPDSFFTDDGRARMAVLRSSGSLVDVGALAAALVREQGQQAARQAASSELAAVVAADRTAMTACARAELAAALGGE